VHLAALPRSRKAQPQDLRRTPACRSLGDVVRWRLRLISAAFSFGGEGQSMARGEK